MKKIIVAILSVVLVFSTIQISALADNNINSNIDGNIENKSNNEKSVNSFKMDLCEAIDDQNYESLKIILDNNKGANFDKYISSAMRTNSTNIIKLILDSGVDVNKDYNHTGSLLRDAVHNENKDVVHLLLEKNADVNIPDSTGFTPLIAAAYEDNYDLVKILLDNGADVSAMEFEDNTALSYALSSNNLETAKLLLDAGSDPNFTNSYGSSLVYLSRNNLDNVKLLVEHGAEINEKDCFKMLQTACFEKDMELANYIINEYGAEMIESDANNIFITSCWEENIDLMKLLIDNYDLDVSSALQQLISSLSSKDVDIKVAEVLLEAGANPNGKDQGLNYTFIAKDIFDNLELYDLLKSYGAR